MQLVSGIEIKGEKSYGHLIDAQKAFEKIYYTLKKNPQSKLGIE